MVDLKGDYLECESYRRPSLPWDMKFPACELASQKVAPHADVSLVPVGLGKLLGLGEARPSVCFAPYLQQARSFLAPRPTAFAVSEAFP